MATFHPLAVEHRRKLYTRQDAWRLAPPRHARGEAARLARSLDDARAAEGSGGGGGTGARGGATGGVGARPFRAALAGQEPENRSSRARPASQVRSEPAATIAGVGRAALPLWAPPQRRTAQATVSLTALMPTVRHWRKNCGV